MRSAEGQLMSTATDPGRGSRRFAKVGATALLPLMLASAGFATGGTARPGGPWSGLWLTAESTAVTGTTLKDVRTIIGADTGAASTLTGAGVGVALIDTEAANGNRPPSAPTARGPD